MTPTLLIVDSGLECVALEESAVAGEVGEGFVLLRESATAPLLELRTVRELISIEVERRVSSLDGVRAAAEELSTPDAATFRVTSRHAHPSTLTRNALERAAGAAIQGRHGTPVDLEQPGCVVRIELFGDRLFIGRPLNERPLDERIRRGAALRSSLRPTTAAAMLRLVGAHERGGRLIDPMCGAGVIPVEARAIGAALQIEAADWDAPTVEVANATFANHELEIEAVVADARRLGEDGARYDFIVTDPPYGVRQARRGSLAELYRTLLGAFERALAPGGRVAIVVVKQRTFQRLVEATGFQVERSCPVAIGGMAARIFVLRSA